MSCADYPPTPSPLTPQLSEFLQISKKKLHTKARCEGEEHPIGRALTSNRNRKQVIPFGMWQQHYMTLTLFMIFETQKRTIASPGEENHVTWIHGKGRQRETNLEIMTKQNPLEGRQRETNLDIMTQHDPIEGRQTETNLRQTWKS